MSIANTISPLAWILGWGWLLIGGQLALAAPPPARQSPTAAVATTDRWKQPLTAAWNQQTLRKILRRIADSTSIGLMVDRRVDGEQELNWQARGQSLENELRALVKHVQLDYALIGSTAYIGPQSTTSRLRTLAQLRLEELPPGLPEPLRTLWREPLPFEWQDLETPRDLLSQIIAPTGFTLREAESIPHDQWASARLQGLNRVEILTLLLAPWDRTFQWDLPRKTLTLIPIPDQLAVRQRIPLASSTPAREFDLPHWQTTFPELRLTRQGNQLIASGLVEDLERLQRELNPAELPAQTGPQPVPLERQKFTLRIRNATLRQLMAELEKSGTSFQYDPSLLDQSGLNLDRKIELDVQGLPAQKFFETLFPPGKFRVLLRGQTVQILPPQS